MLGLIKCGLNLGQARNWSVTNEVMIGNTIHLVFLEVGHCQMVYKLPSNFKYLVRENSQ